MRQGITGLVAGLVAGAVLAGGAAFAVSAVSPVSPGQGLASRDSVRVASQVASHSVDPTATAHVSTDASATHNPWAVGTQTPVSHRERERVAAPAAHPTTQAPHRTQGPAPTPPAVTQNQYDVTDGTVCAPVTVPVVVPTPAPVPCVPPTTPAGEGAHHEGSGHE